MARITSQYGDVYWRAIASKCWRSRSDKTTEKGLLRGIRDTPPDAKSIRRSLFQTVKYVTVFMNRSTKFQEFQQQFLKLGQDLQSGNLSQAQGDFATLQQNAPAGSPLAVSSSALSSGTSPILQEFSPLGQDLQSGNLQSAQQAYALLQQDFQQFAALGGVPGAPSTLRFEPSALHPCANSSGETQAVSRDCFFIHRQGSNGARPKLLRVSGTGTPPSQDWPRCPCPSPSDFS